MKKNPIYTETPVTNTDTTNKAPLWTGKKCPFFGLPWSFTRYTVLGDRLLVKRGLFTLHQEELRLYRIVDVTLRISFLQRLCGIGSVILRSTDSTSEKLILQDIKTPHEVARLISDSAEAERTNRGIVALDCFQSYY